MNNGLKIIYVINFNSQENEMTKGINRNYFFLNFYYLYYLY